MSETDPTPSAPPAPPTVPETELTAPPAPSAEAGGVWNVLKEWWTNAEEGWRFLGGEMERKRLYFKVVLVHLRYTFAYLAFGFAVSAPLQVAAQHSSGWTQARTKCFVLGALFGLPSLLLYPFTIIDWHRMRIPEFKNLELALTRWAVYLSLAFLALAGISFFVGKTKWADEGWLYWVTWGCDWKIAWINVVLMFFAWLRVKFHTILFREFYTLTEDDDLVLLKFGKKESGSDVGDVGEASPASDADATSNDEAESDSSAEAEPDTEEAKPAEDATPDEAKPGEDPKPEA